jgi:hypothetical protein
MGLLRHHAHPGATRLGEAIVGSILLQIVVQPKIRKKTIHLAIIAGINFVPANTRDAHKTNI